MDSFIIKRLQTFDVQNFAMATIETHVPRGT